ncbi:hypothetical protein H8E88_11065 [candidate division KSB1 bacterium]|nr:hypothetical protein [candidate division KSB1 bacterium]MBL7092993.1 hypothetical protein [candidate division KSB1 bacterium]
MKKVNNMNKVKHGYIMRGLLLSIAALFLLGAGEIYATNNSESKPAMAEPAKANDSNEKQQLDKSKISKDAVKVFVKQVQIYGSVAKPQAIFFYKSGDPKADGLKINRHFFDHIFRNVEKNSIKQVRKKQAIKRDHIEW